MNQRDGGNSLCRQRVIRAGEAFAEGSSGSRLWFLSCLHLLGGQMFKASSTLLLVLQERCLWLCRDTEKYFLNLKASMNVPFSLVNTMDSSISPLGPCCPPHTSHIVFSDWLGTFQSFPFLPIPTSCPCFYFLTFPNTPIYPFCSTFSSAKLPCSSNKHSKRPTGYPELDLFLAIIVYHSKCALLLLWNQIQGPLNAVKCSTAIPLSPRLSLQVCPAARCLHTLA